MTLQTLGSPMLYPGWVGIASSGPSVTTQDTLDAAGEYTAGIFRARETMAISHVAFRVGTVSGSGTLDVRIETVSTTDGLPTGTLWATNTNVAGTTLTTTSWNIVALTATANIAAGDVFCVKLAYNSGTSVVIMRGAQLGRMVSPGFPYKVSNTGTPTKGNIASSLALALGSSSSSFYNVIGCMPVTSVSTLNANTSTLSAHGLRFKVPFKCRCIGICHVSQSATTGEYTYGLYDDAGSELSSSSTAVDIDQQQPAAGHQVYRIFDNPVTLDPDTWYRAAIYPTTTTNHNTYGIDMAGVNYMSATPWGANAHYATRSTGGSWIDTDTDTQPLMDIIIDQLDDGVSSGGGTHFSVGG